MLKKMAWNTFKNTGNIDTFLELSKVETLEREIKAEKNEELENKRNNNFGE